VLIEETQIFTWPRKSKWKGQTIIGFQTRLSNSSADVLQEIDHYDQFGSKKQQVLNDKRTIFSLSEFHQSNSYR
jgi:hypothetical protein